MSDKPYYFIDHDTQTETYKLCPGCNKYCEVSCFDNTDRCFICIEKDKKRAEREARKAKPKYKSVQVTPESKLPLYPLRQDLLDLLGGKCQRCGYDEFPAGLHFHHTIPDDKEYNVASLITMYQTIPIQERYNRLISEIDKCIILCANCHTAHHAGYW